MTNVDILEEALQFKEQIEKIKLIKARGTTSEVINGESLDGIEDIIRSVLARRKKKQIKRKANGELESSDDEEDQLPETPI